MSLSHAKASRGGIDIKPPSLPSNIDKIYDGSTEHGPIFNREGFYSDLQNRLEEQQDSLNNVLVRCLAKLKKTTAENITDSLLIKE